MRSVACRWGRMYVGPEKETSRLGAWERYFTFPPLLGLPIRGAPEARPLFWKVKRKGSMRSPCPIQSTGFKAPKEREGLSSKLRMSCPPEDVEGVRSSFPT